MCSRTAGVMTTLMRNGRDRRSGKPVKGQAILERALLVGTRSADHIRASGHNGCIAMGQASTRKQAGYMAAPERFAKRQIHLAPRAPSIHGPLRRMMCGNKMSAYGAIVLQNSPASSGSSEIGQE